MQNFIWPALLTVGAGVSVFVQQVLNANLRAELNSAAWSGFMSYILGVVFMVCLAVIQRDPVPSPSIIARVPWWAWSGGIFGAIFIALSIITIPKLGGAAYIVILVTGQMITALAFDPFRMAWHSRTTHRPAAPARRRLIDWRGNPNTALVKRPPRRTRPRTRLI